MGNLWENIGNLWENMGNIDLVEGVVEENQGSTIPAIQILPNHARSCEWDQLLIFHVVDAVTPPRSQPPLKRAPYEPSGG